MPGIVPQSEYYGLPEREAGSLPPSHIMADILRPTGIPSGTMNTRKHAAEDNRLCKKDNCAAGTIGESGYCSAHDPKTPWGESYHDWGNKVRNKSAAHEDELHDLDREHH